MAQAIQVEEIDVVTAEKRQYVDLQLTQDEAEDLASVLGATSIHDDNHKSIASIYDALLQINIMDERRPEDDVE